MFPCCEAYQPLVAPSDGSNSPPRIRRAATNADIVQFSTAIYYVEDDEGAFQVDVMRLGSMKGAVKVGYSTEDGSAKAGTHYEEAFGEVIFEDGEYRKSLDIRTLHNAYWSATMEFKVVLQNPDSCNLGHHLHACRVKIIDTDTFPSNKYREKLLQGEKGLEEISEVGLFLEYFKLCFFQVPSVSWRTAVCVVMDQMKNAYRYFMLCLNIYIVDVLFNLDDPKTEELLWRPTRKGTAMVVGVAYVAPMLVLHLWDLLKAKMDLVGHLRLYLQSSLFRRYLNYSEESRASVPPADMQHALSLGSANAAKGYMLVLSLFQKFGQLAVFTYFTLLSNPDAIYLILAMPSLMLLFLVCKSCTSGGDEEKKSRQSAVLSLAAEVCNRYRLIADYFQRPQMNDIFAKKTDMLRKDKVPEAMEGVNDEYFPKWLGPLFVGVYIAVYGPSVFDEAISLGTFLATVGIMKDISSEFAEAYELLLEMKDTFESVTKMTVYFNKPTDLMMWKGVNRTRREATKKARDSLFNQTQQEAKDGKEKDGKSGLYKTDLIPIQMTNMGFSWVPEKGAPVFEGVNISVPQGKLVALVGPHGCGKKTLLELLGHLIFPQEGSIFIPSHLRILHVTQETYLLNLSPWQNLIFGCPNPHSVDPARVRFICQRLKMNTVLKLIERDLQQQEELRASTKRPVGEDEEEEEESEAEEEKDWTKDDGEKWQDTLTYSEKVKMHLARALIMNPEVLVLQRPLHHYDETMAKVVLDLLKIHVQEKGLGLPEKGRPHRRPRTCFFTVEDVNQAKEADVVWTIKDRKVGDQVESISLAEAFLAKTPTAKFELPKFHN
ncbi:unnamed protein product [Effrenium voratum]|uniref:ABC transporter domain-containing protein n=1 Tax=Effrenium voratum TaxID=2562239 RepID=A0AA36NFL0_9DINO|nr:unnamed protein product [Effrenium voratum]